MRVCIVTPDFIGPIRNGGIGTASLGAAEALRDAGHEVSVLYGSNHFESGDAQSWSDHYAARSIRFYTLPDAPADMPGWKQWNRSLQVYRHLRGSSYDIVHVPEFLGLGFFTAQAAALNQFDPGTAVVTILHGPTAWSQGANNSGPSSVASLVTAAMEKGAAEFSDAVISPSRHLLEWTKARGWRLPVQHHAHCVLPAANSPARATGSPSASPEIVFFGRIEPRKGAHLFIDAISAMIDAGEADRLSVTFMGKFRPDSNMRDVLGQRLQDWPIRWQVIDDLASDEALAYLCAASNRLAVVPSLHDNSPCTVLECLSRGIPLVATNVGGIAELVAPEQRGRTIVEPDARGLARGIAAAIASGLRPSLPTSDHAARAARVVSLHEEICEAKRETARRVRGRRRRRQRSSSIKPFISVCILHRDRPKYLLQALAGYAAQDFTDFEVVIADNGSRGDAAVRLLDRLERERRFAFPLRIVALNENRFPPGGRNAAAAAALGAWLKFHDEDNVAKPHELSTFAEAAASGGAQAISCALDVFDGEAAPNPRTPIIRTATFLGDGGAACYLENVMGDANLIVERQVFEAVGGFIDRGHLTFAEDWGFLARVKGRGYKVATIPEALVWYRTSSRQDAKNWRKTDIAGARIRARDELMGTSSDELEQLVALAQFGVR